MHLKDPVEDIIKSGMEAEALMGYLLLYKYVGEPKSVTEQGHGKIESALNSGGQR